MTEQNTKVLGTEKSINDILGTVEREREREIIARRFGLFDRKETLEQIGELLGITRERVRQLEKAVLARLKAAGAEQWLATYRGSSAANRGKVAVGRQCGTHQRFGFTPRARE